MREKINVTSEFSKIAVYAFKYVSFFPRLKMFSSFFDTSPRKKITTEV